MEKLALRIIELIEKYRSVCSSLDQGITGINRDVDSWSIKQIIGHLVDSASNNHQRFVRLQLTDTLQFPDYKKDEWLGVQNYNSYEFNGLCEVFYAYNRLLAHLLRNMKETDLSNRWMTTFLKDRDHITLSELAVHYVEHLEIHFDHLNKRIEELIKK